MTDPPAAGDPRYDGFRVSFLWGFFAIDPGDDQEGLIGIPDGTGGTMPLIASDRVRLSDLRPIAQRIARSTGRPVTLRRFVSDPEPLEVFTP